MRIPALLCVLHSTDMQENTRARLRDSRPGTRARFTQPTYFNAFLSFDQKCLFKGIHLLSLLCVPKTENCSSLCWQWQPQPHHTALGILLTFYARPCRSSSTKRRHRSFSAECNPIVCRRRQFNATMALINIGESFTFPEFHANEVLFTVVLLLSDSCFAVSP